MVATIMFVVRDTDLKITQQLQIMKSYAPAIQLQCFIALNQVYVPLFHMHKEKVLELITKLQI